MNDEMMTNALPPVFLFRHARYLLQGAMKLPARHKHEEEISKLNLPHVSPEQPPFVGKPELEVKDRVFYGEEGHVYLPDGLYVCEESGECCGRQAQAER